jgi:iron complex transport system ATP-binding protein
MVAKNKTLLSVRDLRVERSRTILDGLSWTVESGQHWAILGPNGSGKTSVLRALFGYLPATAGEIEVLGRVYGRSEWAKVRESVGLVSQSLLPRIPPEQPLAEVILSGRDAQLEYWGDEIAEELGPVKRLLKEMALARRGDEPWGILSQGERQRALLGRALCGRKQLLFLDEPCAGLDPVAREHFLGHLNWFAGTPRAPGMMLITHHIEEVIPAITHVLLLAEGQVVAAGPKAEILTTALLSKTFGEAVKVRRSGDRYRLSIDAELPRSWFA